MKILGLQKTTLLDYPGKVAATIFLGGCNLRCPFCHNMNLVEPDSSTNEYSYDYIINFLSTRKNLLDGVCITGGEPTINSTLPSFINNIKSLGLLVKLDTNGTNPTMLKQLINDSLIDYVAMDIKTSLNNYPIVCGVDSFNTEPILESIHLLINGHLDYEFRTTLISKYHNIDVIKDIGNTLKGAKSYYLQSFIDSDYVPNHNLSAPSKEDLLAYCNVLREYISNVAIRGTDI